MSAKKILAVMFFFALSATAVFGQQTANYPFPQNVVYPYGNSQSTIASSKAESWYSSWKNAHIKSCSGKGIMPTADDANTVKVEGMGWAMIATAYMGDKDNFDGIYQFYKAYNKEANEGGMMKWKVSCENKLEDGSATDGDLDVAFALVVASWQWGGDYLDEAKKVINNCEKLIRTCSNGGSSILALAGGYSGGPYGGSCDSYTDISYYTPAFFRVFAEVSGNSVWETLANDAYIHLERNAHPTTGLVSDWQNVSTGVAMKGPGNNDTDTTYRHDASRVAWRISLDYLWNENENAKNWLTKVTDWVVNTLGVNNLKEGHNRDGTATNSTDAGMAFLGSFAVGSLANDSSNVRTTLLNAIKDRNDTYWYHRHTGNMYLLAVTGNMWNESMVAGDGFTLRTTVDGGGQITRSPNKTLYEEGEQVTLTAVPNNGWKFDGWSDDASGTDATTTITMDANKAVTANFSLEGGVNLVKNGDFSSTSDWTLNEWDDSKGSFTVNNNEAIITISALPSEGKIYNFQLVQNGISLIEGYKYILSFDAHAASARDIEVMLQMDGGDYTTYYSKDVSLTTQKESFVFEFIMEKETDENGRLGFNLGNDTSTVYISNVSLVYVADTTGQTKTLNSPIKTDFKIRSISNGMLLVESNASSAIYLYNTSGKLVQKAQVSAGSSLVKLSVPNGIYVVKNVKTGQAQKILVK